VYLEVVWDEANLQHATKRATVAEITQVIRNARSYTKGKTGDSGRALIVGETDGGRRLTVVVEVRSPAEVRPITAIPATRPRRP
jgi:uncharacterized DUF497 family protein